MYVMVLLLWLRQLQKMLINSSMYDAHPASSPFELW
jgi:hypothetical protein